MMTEDCDKYLKKAKYGTGVFSIVFIIVVLKKANIIDQLFGNSYDNLFIGIMIVAFVITTILTMPYITCLSKYKKQ